MGFLPYVKRDTIFTIQVIVVCITWYSCSSGQNVVNKLALQKFPFPLTIALSSLINNVIYSIPLMAYFRIEPIRPKKSYLLKTILPISAGRALGVGFAYFGLLKVPVSYAQTVKATMPVFTVVISRYILSEVQSKRVYLSLLPIICGVFVASVTELQFNSMGLFSSLFSTAVFACLNVLAKKVFEETNMHPLNLLSLNSQLAGLMLFPFWFLKDGMALWSTFTDSEHSRVVEPISHFVGYLLMSGVLSFIQNLCAFLLIHQLTTLSYAISNAAKRIAVIIISLIYLRNPVTPMNFLGMLLSVIGVFIYNRIKSSERRKRSKSPLIPEKMDDYNDTKFLRRHERVVNLGGMRSTNSDVKLLLSS
ncbi:unnamed protein product [Bursaphelenchus xylophilus]|uniref:(pine wood nematode) hypothetical protein n=1 Tax=Bursaphelenchus xylophilus TaxID=6326 RepID=A0A1I7RPS8_BURXY|nr:unnamed protein product [Bursaphelenchus xylophilus]CAG9096549.1 unnamed protein product [Bursaphelenchus xylophilus]